MKTRNKKPSAQAIKEEYPYRKEQGDFLRINEMRGSMGIVSLGFGIVFLLVSAILAGLILSDSTSPKVHLIFPLAFAALAIAWNRKMSHLIAIGMYYYTYVGRDEIRWGDMYEHTSINVSELAKVHIWDVDGMGVIMKLKNGKTLQIDERHLTDMDKLYERIKLIDNIEVTYESCPRLKI